MNCWSRKPSANVRLICFPWGGGGTHFFTSWGQSVADDIEVNAVCLPGRENRSNEPFCYDGKVAIDSVVEIIKKDLCDKPFAFWGHSIGAILGFWVACELKKRYNIEPVHMFISGAQPPHSQGFQNMLTNPDDEYVDQMMKSGGLPERMQKNKEMMDLFLPIFLADLAVLKSFPSLDHKKGSPPILSCPLDLFVGEEEDPEVKNYLDDWKPLTSGLVSKHILPGSHFFFMDNDANMKKFQNFIEMALEDVE